MRCKALTIAVASFALSILSSGTLAQDEYPSQPINIIAPYTAGGSYDAVARIIGKKLTEKWGQQVVIINRPGAAGEIGTAVAAEAPADGYHLAMFGNSQTILPSIDPDLRFDIVRHFRPIARVATVAQVIAVSPSVPAQSLKELIALAKSRPGKMNFGSGGAGGHSHLAAELLKSMAGIDMVHVPFKGQVPAMLSLFQNDIQLLIVNLIGATPQIKAGKMRPVAITTLSRSPFLPTVPTASESGLTGYESVEWYGLLAPSKTPDAIVAKLHQEISRIMQLKDIHDDLRNLSANPVVGDTPEAFAQFIKADLAQNKRIVESAKLTIRR